MCVCVLVAAMTAPVGEAAGSAACSSAIIHLVELLDEFVGHHALVSLVRVTARVVLIVCKVAY